MEMVVDLPAPFTAQKRKQFALFYAKRQVVYRVYVLETFVQMFYFNDVFHIFFLNIQAFFRENVSVENARP